MASSWRRTLAALLSKRRASGPGNPRPPQLETLGERIMPATRVWDGGALLNDNWKDPKNWVGDVAPVSGDALRFPAGVGALDRSTNNDFGPGTFFDRIEFG